MSDYRCHLLVKFAACMEWAGGLGVASGAVWSVLAFTTPNIVLNLAIAAAVLLQSVLLLFIARLARMVATLSGELSEQQLVLGELEEALGALHAQGEMETAPDIASPTRIALSVCRPEAIKAAPSAGRHSPKRFGYQDPQDTILKVEELRRRRLITPLAAGRFKGRIALCRAGVLGEAALIDEWEQLCQRALSQAHSA